jgi:hypothetical protein
MFIMQLLEGNCSLRYIIGFNLLIVPLCVCVFVWVAACSCAAGVCMTL